MVYGKFVTEGRDIETVRAICNKVFAEELGLDISGNTGDEFCMNALVYAGEKPACAGRISFDGESFAIDRIAVLPERRGESYGDFMVRLLVDKAVMSNAKEIHLDALQGTEGFFSSIGFEKAGDLFERSGGIWQPMILCTDKIHKCCG